MSPVLPLLCFAFSACRGTQTPDAAEGTGGSESSASSETSAGTGGESGTGATDTGGGETGGGSDGAFDLPALTPVSDAHFATSLVCADCHANADAATAMRDELGQPIGPDDLWTGTMMANSARDPFWWAMVRAETLATPSAAEHIEDTCTACHAPMASARDDLFGGPFELDELLDPESERGQFGLDGVACATCHQVPPGDDLGPPALEAAGRMYGPHATPFTMPMINHTGFEPVESSHMLESATCGGCHTLRTEPLNSEGEALGGVFSEQAPYLEWRNSDFTTETPGAAQPRSCQDCHMPTESAAGVSILTRIARRPMGDDFPPIEPRSPYGRHIFTGGNTLVLSMLRDHADELRPRGTTAALDAGIARTREFLGSATATLELADAQRDADTLELQVRVRNLTGHKFPAGIPVRRAWLRVEIQDGSGGTVFRSGHVDASGRLVDGQGAPLPSEAVGGPIYSHHADAITDPAQVQVYESVLADADEAPTYRLLRATSYVKDNRLLPRGWSPTGPHAEETAPVLGGDDADFTSGEDIVTYRVLAPSDGGPYTALMSLHYQPISARDAAELFEYEADEIQAFERMWNAADHSPEVVASESFALP